MRQAGLPRERRIPVWEGAGREMNGFKKNPIGEGTPGLQGAAVAVRTGRLLGLNRVPGLEPIEDAEKFLREPAPHAGHDFRGDFPVERMGRAAGDTGQGVAVAPQ